MVFRAGRTAKNRGSLRVERPHLRPPARGEAYAGGQFPDLRPGFSPDGKTVALAALAIRRGGGGCTAVVMSTTMRVGGFSRTYDLAGGKYIASKLAYDRFTVAITGRSDAGLNGERNGWDTCCTCGAKDADRKSCRPLLLPQR